MSATASLLDSLETVLAGFGAASIAVSGGVDSMTLAVVAGRRLGGRAQMFHAASPAVPAEASERVRRYAAVEGWSLAVFDAGEFDDPRYRANPANRCFFCKTNLYDSIAARTDRTILSGTNMDDLGDYRPGLEAAAAHDVRHPYVEAGIDKAGVRAIAAYLGLDDLQALPAAPCLSSRVETGLAIEPDVLTRVHAAERFVARRIGAATVRCRVRRDVVVIELDSDTLAGLSESGQEAVTAEVARMFRAEGDRRPVTLAAYRMGSAFLRDGAR
ncbi:MAG: adenine nucleotide alpha hydrolase [Rhodospirillaceae bacterium]|nr:adenine nucleotide alpha hydrolase [Rhodospirillaceae bacterium]